jgi:hypothetical protein
MERCGCDEVPKASSRLTYEEMRVCGGRVWRWTGQDKTRHGSADVEVRDTLSRTGGREGSGEEKIRGTKALLSYDLIVTFIAITMCESSRDGTE